jgi:hypothetical protein
MSKNVPAAIAATLLVASATGASAATLFANDFAKGLGANEFVSGSFSAADGYVGHHPDYAINDVSAYGVALDLTGITDAFIDFDFLVDTERGFDFVDLMQGSKFLYRFTGLDGGHAHLALAPASGLTTISYNFQSDFAINDRGFRLDNLAITGTPSVTSGAVPEPASWAMLLCGFAAIGGCARIGKRPPKQSMLQRRDAA